MDGTAVATPTDDLDLLGYQELERHVDSILHNGKTRIVLDLSAVTYINSVSVNTLIGLREKVRKAGGHFALACVRSGARMALEAGGAMSTLAVHDSVEEAAATMSG
jgi:anti-sigma B factor antagonist